MATKPKTKTVAPKKTSSPAPSLKMVSFTGVKAADALAAASAAKTGKLHMVDPEMIVVVPKFNIRIDSPANREAIREIADSIKSEGFMDTQPLGVFPAEIDGESVLALISGHNRYAAAMLAISEGADIPTLPVVLKKPSSTDEELNRSLVKENLHSRPSMMDNAVLAKRFMNTGLDDEEVAKEMGKSTRYIKDLKTLMNAPKEVRELIKNDRIAAYEAIRMLRKDPTGKTILEADAKAQEKAEKAESAKAAKLTKKTVEGGGEKLPKARDPMVTEKMNFQVEAGAEFMYEDVKPFLSLIEDDETWFKGTKSTKKKIALSALEFIVTIKRAKTQEELDAEAEAEKKAEAAQAAVKASKAGAKPPKAGAKKAAPVGDGLDDDDDDLLGDGLDDDDAPNLKELGIAEPAGADL